MRTTPPPHYVRHNKSTRVPRNFVYFDSEANRTPAPAGEVQTFRCAVAARDRRKHDRDEWGEREWGAFTAPAALWEWVHVRTEARARTVVVAHNLAYDLRITNALVELPALGWELSAIRLGRGSTWATWKLDGRTLSMVDSYSWLPVALERIGELCEVPKLPLPEWEDSDEAWFARCRRDVEIVAEAWRRLIGFVKAEDLGNFKPTGAGQAWAAYRHRFRYPKLLAHGDTDVADAERASAYTGRCEVWTHGRPAGGPFTEWDFSTAYANVCATCDVPVRLAGESMTANVDQWRRLSKRYAVLAEVEVTTETPTVPTRHDGRICWPVGTFTSTLWENELSLAIENGATVTVRKLWWYHRAPALSDFARWCLTYIEPGPERVDPVVALAVKHWSRALVGRFGARWSEWETIGVAPDTSLRLSTVIDRAEGSRWRMLQVGTNIKRCTSERDGPDAVVAVMAWVMAECRVRLWHLATAAGAGQVVYMDTDSVITTAEGSQRLSEAGYADLRRKGTWHSVDIFGPRQIETGGVLRAAGVPKRATKVGKRTYRGEVFSELMTDLAGAKPDSVRVTTRTVHLRGTDTRREHLPAGDTAPIRLPA